MFYKYFSKKKRLLTIFPCIWLFSHSILQADNWKTGRAMQDALNAKVRFQSTGKLKDDLLSLSQNSKVAIYLDREIDPGQRIHFPTELQPLGKTLEEVALQVGGLSINVGSLIYIAPRGKALSFNVFRKRQAYLVDGLPLETRQAMQKSTELAWDQLANPRDLVTNIAENCGLQVRNPQAIPHDLWSGQRLTRLPKWEQLTFLLACMNHSFQLDRGTNELIVFPVSAKTQVTLRFSKSGSAKIQNVLRKSKMTTIQQAVQGEYLFVRGSLSDMAELTDTLRVKRKWNSTIKSNSKHVFDLDTYASRGSILATLAKNRNVKLRYDEAIVETLNKKIELNFKQVTIEELLSATLEGSGLSYQLTETELIIKR